MIQKVMPWLETFYFNKKRFPTDGEWLTKWSIEPDLLLQLKVNTQFRRACSRRGISFNPLSTTGSPDFIPDLLPEQVAAISVLTNFADNRPRQIKLASLGITVEQLNGWMVDPEFKRQLGARADEALDNIYPDAVAALGKRVKQGNTTALKFYFELTGRASTPAEMNVRLAMQQLIEAVQKHVKDPSVLEAIARDFQAVQQLNSTSE